MCTSPSAAPPSSPPLGPPQYSPGSGVSPDSPLKFHSPRAVLGAEPLALHHGNNQKIFVAIGIHPNTQMISNHLKSNQVFLVCPSCIILYFSCLLLYFLKFSLLGPLFHRFPSRRVAWSEVSLRLSPLGSPAPLSTPACQVCYVRRSHLLELARGKVEVPGKRIGRFEHVLTF